jgi:hypothetical protein
MMWGEMNIRDIIAYVSPYPREMRLKRGFTNPHSYRGYYEELGVVWAPNVSIGEMIDMFQGAIGSTYQGWKGGDYTMDEKRDVFVVHGVGETGEPVSTWMLRVLLQEVSG